MATEWFCKIMGDEWGPMSAEELTAVARWGRLTRDDIVRRGAQGTWVRAELVEGLFDAPPVASTATAKRVVTGVKCASPAKRSVRRIVPKQYWVKVEHKIAGPFSARELRKLAQQGALKPHHYVSDNCRHWVQAARVSGLTFGGAAAEEETVSVRSAIWLDQPLDSPDFQLAETASCDAAGIVH